MTDRFRSLARRAAEIDFKYKHRHLPTCLSALPIMIEIYDQLGENDIFILSKGHAASGLYAILEERGLHPDVSKIHPDRDVANGIEITSGSLGHGLPMALGMALAKKLKNEPGKVYILIGDGESLEGTTWETLNLAAHFGAQDTLKVYLDANGFQGSCSTIVETSCKLNYIYPVKVHRNSRSCGIGLFERNPNKSVHLITESEYQEILKDLK